MEQMKSFLLAAFISVEVALAVLVALSMALVETSLVGKIGISLLLGFLVFAVACKCCSVFLNKPKMDFYEGEK